MKEEENKSTLILITNDRMGHGDDTLGFKLMENFIKHLNEMGSELWRLVLLNNGVKLTTQESETLIALKDLETEGLVILVCSTCLNHFGLLDKKQIGVTTNMPDIVNAMQVADKVITL